MWDRSIFSYMKSFVMKLQQLAGPCQMPQDYTYDEAGQYISTKLNHTNRQNGKFSNKKKEKREMNER